MPPVSPEVARLSESLRVQNPDAQPLIERAWQCARRAYRGKRHYRVPLLRYAYEVAETIAKRDLGGWKTVTAALLHAVPPDDPAYRSEIERELGPKILFLLEGFAALSRIRSADMNDTESFFKTFIGTARDFRVLIVKLVLELHTLRSAASCTEAERRAIASEAMCVYAPLAHQLSMRTIAQELEDRAFEIQSPGAYRSMVRELGLQQEQRESDLETLKEAMVAVLRDDGVESVGIESRIKGVYSIYQKREQRSADTEQIFDLKALRVFVRSNNDCYRALGSIHRRWTPLPGRIKDYIALPKENGYQSLHTTILVGDGTTAEIQIRTREMHEYAEWGIAAHLGYKNSRNGLLTRWFRRFFPAQNGSVRDLTLEAKIPKVPQWIRDLIDPEAYVTMRAPDTAHGNARTTH